VSGAVIGSQIEDWHVENGTHVPSPCHLQKTKPVSDCLHHRSPNPPVKRASTSTKHSTASTAQQAHAHTPTVTPLSPSPNAPSNAARAGQGAIATDRETSSCHLPPALSAAEVKNPACLLAPLLLVSPVAVAAVAASKAIVPGLQSWCVRLLLNGAGPDRDGEKWSCTV
jgi:hypothetical protein